MIFFLRKKKAKKSRAKKPVKTRSTAKTDKELIEQLFRKKEEYIRYKSVPEIIAVISNKGGVGKSYIAANLAAVLALANKKNAVYVVDLDFDASTVTELFSVSASIPSVTRAASAASIIISAHLEEPIIPARVSTMSCLGEQVFGALRFLPALDLHKARAANQKVAISKMPPNDIVQGISRLFEILRFQAQRERSKGRNPVIIVDCKQKSDIGINYDAVYRETMRNADALLFVTSPEEKKILSFLEIAREYSDYYSKMIVVINKVPVSYQFGVLKFFIEDALKRGIPSLLVPELPDSRIYREFRLPVLESLASPTATYMLAIGYFLGHISGGDLDALGCRKPIEVLKLLKNIYDSLSRSGT